MFDGTGPGRCRLAGCAGDCCAGLPRPGRCRSWERPGGRMLTGCSGRGIGTAGRRLRRAGVGARTVEILPASASPPRPCRAYAAGRYRQHPAWHQFGRPSTRCPAPRRTPQLHLCCIRSHGTACYHTFPRTVDNPAAPTHRDPPRPDHLDTATRTGRSTALPRDRCSRGVAYRAERSSSAPLTTGHLVVRRQEARRS